MFCQPCSFKAHKACYLQWKEEEDKHTYNYNENINENLICSLVISMLFFTFTLNVLNEPMNGMFSYIFHCIMVLFISGLIILYTQLPSISIQAKIELSLAICSFTSKQINYVGVRRSPTTRSQTSPKCFVFCFFNSIKREEK